MVVFPGECHALARGDVGWGEQHALCGAGEGGDGAGQTAPLDQLGTVVGPPRGAVRPGVDGGAKVAVCLTLVLPCEQLAGAEVEGPPVPLRRVQGW